MRKIGDTIVKIDGDPENPLNLGKICAKGNAGIMDLYNPNRVTKALIRTNSKKGYDQDPKWETVGNDEAINIIVERLHKVYSDDPRKFIFGTFDVSGISWQVSSAFLDAFKTTSYWWGGAGYFCGNNVHPFCYLTHGSFIQSPDLKFCNYLMVFGSGIGTVVGLLTMKHADEMAQARMRGMKLVVFDPVGVNAAAKADLWVPIRPGTDGAMALGMLNLLVNEYGIFDQKFLKIYTTSPYLVDSDGRFVKEQGKPALYDLYDSKVKKFDDETLTDPALSGTYTVGHTSARPSFELLKEHLKRYTPEWTSEITSVDSSLIKTLTKEYGENAGIGKTIKLEGRELPYRPACTHWERGASAHKNAWSSGQALALMNVIIGAVDVPGGSMGMSPPIGPWWEPGVDENGILIPSHDPYIVHVSQPLPLRRVIRPQTLTSFELFPAAVYSDPMLFVNLAEPRLCGINVKPEVFISALTNPIASVANPALAYKLLMEIPFLVDIVSENQESSRIADVILPAANYLERTDVIANGAYQLQEVGLGEWVWNVRQPVVDKPPGVRDWIEYLFEIAYKLGLVEEFNAQLNAHLDLKPPYELDLQTEYTYLDVLDRVAKNKFGEEHGLEFFKKYGLYISGKKSIREAYPRPFLKGRISTTYMDWMIQAKEDVEKVTGEMNLKWDVHAYGPLPNWSPCPDLYARGEYDLFAANFKLSFTTHSRGPRNSWLRKLTQGNRTGFNVMMNPLTATKKGISDGEEVELRSPTGAVRATVTYFECVHPEVVGVSGTHGRMFPKTPGANFNDLLSHDLDRIDSVSAALDQCVRVSVEKVTP